MNDEELFGHLLFSKFIQLIFVTSGDIFHNGHKFHNYHLPHLISYYVLAYP